jgi:excisionase family DNA binding protein
MTDSSDDDFITLDEAAKLIPGADADTLKRMRRRGKLTCYRPGKAFLTTRADVREAVKQCHAFSPAERREITKPTPSEIELSRMALDRALENLRGQSSRNKQRSRVGDKP